jgi:hypothetical protein
MANDGATRSIGRRLSDHAGTALGGGAALLLVMGTVVYRWLEDWSWVDSFYFSAVAVTTVGFGDLSPTTDGSKLFTVFYLAAGIAGISAYFNQRFNRVTERAARRRGDRA